MSQNQFLTLSLLDEQALDFIARRYSYADFLKSKLVPVEEQISADESRIDAVFSISDEDLHQVHALASEEGDGYLPMLAGQLLSKVVAAVRLAITSKRDLPAADPAETDVADDGDEDSRPLVLINVTLDWNSADDSEGDYATSVWARDTDEAIKLVAEEMADSGEKEHDSEEDRQSYIDDVISSASTYSATYASSDLVYNLDQLLQRNRPLYNQIMAQLENAGVIPQRNASATTPSPAAELRNLAFELLQQANAIDGQ